MTSEFKDQQVSQRAAQILHQHEQQIYARTDRMFAVLLVGQWAAAVLGAMWFTPRTWSGTQWSVHPHVWLAVFLGGALCALPIWFVWRRPGAVVTRQSVAIAQVLFSTLLIQITGGRLETHFHVFGSLAFLAAYRDWRVLISATAVVAADHFIRGVYWPQSVFGIYASSPWRWVEHSTWVLFEDLFLIIVIRQTTHEMQSMSMQAAQLQDATERAEAANRIKGEFVANMSHEIRTPLNAILGYTEILARDEKADARQRREYVDTIRTGGRHLLELINNILDLSKIEFGRLQVERSRFSPHQLIADVASVLRVQAQERGISLEYRWEGPIPETIDSDSHRLRQLLINLVGNAIKFTHQGSVIIVARIARDVAGDQLTLEVQDTGIGIPADRLDDIFKSFVQADSSMTRCYGGTGLGLTISKNLAVALGGDLSVESQLGRGSVFTASVGIGDLEGVPMHLTLPTSPVGDVVDLRTKAANLTGVRVLLADDGETNRKLMNLFLTREGAEVSTAVDGDMACRMALGEQFDVVLMDMQMPVMDGYAATRKLREHGFERPIIALTAHAMRGDREKCQDAGCSGFITKPVNVDELVLQVRAAAGAERIADEPTPSVGSAKSHGPSDAVVHSSLPTSDAQIREIVQEFVDSVPARIEAIDRALRESNYDEISRLAHGLKGAGGTAGYDGLMSLGAQIEQCVVGREVDALKNVIDELKSLNSTLAV
jgi:signal transduction histidine kinase/CheY-like chemotaxis protein/HPt (histidine-containing phosphotransfer) domain-containing protein